jgi:hypothetical protein
MKPSEKTEENATFYFNRFWCAAQSFFAGSRNYSKRLAAVSLIVVRDVGF